MACLSFQLDPSDECQKKVLGKKYLSLSDVVLKSILSTKEKKPGSEHAKKYYCDRPWHPDNENHRLEGKRINHRDFKEYFENSTISAVVNDFVCESPSANAVTLAMSSHTLADNALVSDPSTVLFGESIGEKENNKQLPINNSKVSINDPIVFVNYSTQTPNLQEPVDQNNVIDQITANKIIHALAQYGQLVP